MPLPEVSLNLQLVLNPTERRVHLSLEGAGTNHFQWNCQVTFGNDMLYERTQEHLNNALRAITNHLTKLEKEYKR